ncbi:18067_t:CDS:2, partial [Acaulospora morrowiae]
DNTKRDARVKELEQKNIELDTRLFILEQGEKEKNVTDDNSAETLDFIEMAYKEQVSNEIMERIREKKLRDQKVSSGKQNTSSGELEELMPPPIMNSVKASKYVPSKVVQGLLQGFLENSIGKNIEIINSEPSNSAPAEIAHLLYQATYIWK